MTTTEQILEKYPNAQVNPAGQIALRCIREGQYLLTDLPSKKEYIAVTEVGICMVWVDPIDVDFILKHKKMGCCNRLQKAYYLANEQAVRIWTNRGGR